MKGFRNTVVAGVAFLAVLAGSARGNIWPVPTPLHPTIQRAIDDAQVVDGDTISVWGNGSPPYYYCENVDFGSKSVFVVNRSFLPGATGYDSSWEHVVIDGGQQGAVVTIGSSATSAVLKGFTIQNGLNNGSGGGVACFAGSVLKNHIQNNSTEMDGGGVCCDPYGAPILICDNLVEHNSAPTGAGGGIAVLGWPTIEIRRNFVSYNTAEYFGGGIYLFCVQPGFPQPYDGITDNTVEDNTLTATGATGSGVYAQNWPQAARRNVVRFNYQDGVYLAVTQFGVPMDWGRPTDPGLNLLAWNGPLFDECSNLSVVFEGPARPVNAVGNYWGRLDTRYIWAHISQPPGTVSINPVAASSKWFNIAYDVRFPDGDLCETDVLVTGDLNVYEGGTLRIVPGKTFEFLSPPDDSSPGGDPAMTDLMVHAFRELPGTLTVTGTAEAPVIFRPSPLSPMAWWGGIRVFCFGYANISHARITHAHVGIDVVPEGEYGGNLTLADSRVDSCAFAGVHLRNAWSGVICHDSITHNGVCGVEVCPPDDPYTNTINCNWVLDNGVYGIHIVGPSDASMPSTVFQNTVRSPLGTGSALAGIALEHVGSMLTLFGNRVSGFHSAGLSMMESHASSMSDTLTGNLACNIRCMGLSTDLGVRHDVLDNSSCGVDAGPFTCVDLGTFDEPGMNSILTGNNIYVQKIGPDSVQARYNWWGTDQPDPFKFAGPVAYIPFLTQPPDGGQSAGSASVLNTGLGECRPSPVTSRATISYSIGARGYASLQMLDAAGRVVRDLAAGVKEPGRYSVTWDCRDSKGRTAPKGVYFCRLAAASCRQTKKVVVAR